MSDSRLDKMTRAIMADRRHQQQEDSAYYHARGVSQVFGSGSTESRNADRDYRESVEQSARTRRRNISDF